MISESTGVITFTIEDSYDGLFYYFCQYHPESMKENLTYVNNGTLNSATVTVYGT